MSEETTTTPVSDGQTVEAVTKELETIKEALAVAKKQAEEKQKLIDEHRPEISALKDELKALQEKLEAVPAQKPEVKPEVKPVEEKTAEQIKAENDARIAAMSAEDRQKFAEDYNSMTDEQMKYLATPEGMSTFLKERVNAPVASSNPFAVPEKKPDPKAQFEALFGAKNKPPVGKTKGVGFQPDAVVKVKNADARTKQIEEARAHFNII